ncbi:MAG: hypothetical protein E4H17_01820 [Gemmatimonadales bacterium]|nr:MAG: hypothetical protein E4H17_01820 [Gemmatimonadales bacterium]
MRLAGERWTPASWLMFGPRWALALPLVVLVPWALWRRRRLFLPLALGAAIVFGPLMDLRVPRRPPPGADRPVLRVLSCNVGGSRCNPDALLRLIVDSGADLVSLQEYPYGLRLALPAGWHEIRPHEGGITLFSRYPLRAVQLLRGQHLPDPTPHDCLLSASVRTPAGEVAVHALHLPTARFGILHDLAQTWGLWAGSPGFAERVAANRARMSRQAVDVVRAQRGPAIVAGDFNMPVESSLYRDDWGGLVNAFSRTGAGYGWSSRGALRGIPVPIRIDHVLCGGGIEPLACRIGPDVGSDHRPVLADLRLPVAR